MVHSRGVGTQAEIAWFRDLLGPIPSRPYVLAAIGRYAVGPLRGQLIDSIHIVAPYLRIIPIKLNSKSRRIIVFAAAR